MAETEADAVADFDKNLEEKIRDLNQNKADIKNSEQTNLNGGTEVVSEIDTNSVAETNQMTVEKNLQNLTSFSSDDAQESKELSAVEGEPASSDNNMLEASAVISNENSMEVQDKENTPSIQEEEKKLTECKDSTFESKESKLSIDELPVDPQNCYCRRGRNLNIVELQCGGCSKWFHEPCITISLGKCLPFMTYYTFCCKHCSATGIETFSKKQPNFSQICGTAIANLMQQSSADGQPRTMFSKDKEVIPYIVANWEHLTPMQRRIKQTWHNTVHKVMVKDSDIFMCEEKNFDDNSSTYPMFGLVNQDLAKIGPSYDSVSRGPQKLNIDSSSSQGGTAFSSKGRSSKRKIFDNQMSTAGKRVKSDLVMPKLPPNGYPMEHPFNKDGYRYILAEPDPHAPFRQEFDESQDWAGKPIPGWLYRKLTPSNVLIALHDRAPQLKVSEDRLSVTGEKGYCMVRATHGVNRGTWYFECTIDEMPDGAATRLGWSQPLGNLQGPLGYDKFSYSWRSRKSTKFHESKGYHYNDEGYGQGDVLGFLIHLPHTANQPVLPPIYKDKPLVKFKSYLYYEEKDELQLELKNMKPLFGSKIVFYKNGKNMGVAFENINVGTYYPAVSLYKSVTVTLNFGPEFKYPPNENYKPIYDLADEATIEQTMTDLLFFTENKGKLRLDTL
ncbi:set1/Ash2 histone methyltransferase complex subunit ASH2-like [Uloborus diversus]|uniref:set1/Ash2 histone methyltransferase complex subunit ASH2-like n=1 Tax=Uloborus diversus TaxID=327109 RepID=UPI00240A8FA3|nr:set1/Ash2 histone methyltransferase complex subunit ASH2-like [Uloborus diversus]